MVYIGEHLRAYREKHKLTQEEFAERIFVTPGYLAKLESTSIRTRKAMSNTLLITICETFRDYSLYEIWDSELGRFIREERIRNSRKIS